MNSKIIFYNNMEKIQIYVYLILNENFHHHGTNIKITIRITNIDEYKIY